MSEPAISVDDEKYVINGTEYPRLSVVTSQIPNPFLEKWREEVGAAEADRIAAEAASYGDMVHLVTLLNDTKQDEELDLLLNANPSMIPNWVAWGLWVKRSVKEMVAVERVVWSDKYWCAGRLDRVAVMVGDRSPSILDLKTGSVYPDMGVDLAGYRYMWNEREKRKAKRRLVVHMPRRNPGEIAVREMDDAEDEKKWKDMCEDFKALVGGG